MYFIEILLKMVNMYYYLFIEVYDYLFIKGLSFVYLMMLLIFFYLICKFCLCMGMEWMDVNVMNDFVLLVSWEMSFMVVFCVIKILCVFFLKCGEFVVFFLVLVFGDLLLGVVKSIKVLLLWCVYFMVLFWICCMYVGVIIDFFCWWFFVLFYLFFLFFFLFVCFG